MAYMNQERKAEKAPAIKALLKEFGLKGSLSVNNHSSLVLTVAKGGIDFFQNTIDAHVIYQGCRHNDGSRDDQARGHMQVNEYYLEDHFSGTALAFLKKAKSILDLGNHDHSDAMTDYFNVGWYISINIGRWNKPYQLA